MASAARSFGGAVYGSLAYDLNRLERMGDERYARPNAREQERSQPQVQKRVVTRTRRAIHTKQAIAPTAILGILVAAFLLVSGITAQVQVLSVSGESVALEGRVRELQEQQTRLRIQYESAFNLAEIEEYAIGSLGMQKPNANQITYIDTSAPDKAVVVDAGTGDSFVDRVSDFLAGLGAYF